MVIAVVLVLFCDMVCAIQTKNVTNLIPPKEAERFQRLLKEKVSNELKDDPSKSISLGHLNKLNMHFKILSDDLKKANKNKGPIDVIRIPRIQKRILETQNEISEERARLDKKVGSIAKIMAKSLRKYQKM
ncbi:hypothetical protein EIN_230770 [Entamoeba invadens IP1]|uniref:Uncharacterized protein n=1 Tax=Entamoeba invadens IP1 TaxID=370355 RepID=A0A0A1U375_ENTIV|nr:hypothetical protein EIN_230770 [Entamoeba invadens IP1]ELP88474.1 hypothetical protein EIN_230770 [Entamoeba invadens IP1]|eukprot:XP_004255245.1 hypothetical protein EIN_230770 [Entamoeba invadens IP1]